MFFSDPHYVPAHSIACVAMSLVLAIVIAGYPAWAQGSLSQPRIAYALGGGGARGAAHIGALRVLDKAGIKPDIVFASSTGAVIGGWYCAGISLEAMEKWTLDGTVAHAFMPMPIWLKIFLNSLRSAGLLWHNPPYPGIFSGRQIANLVNKAVKPDQQKIENLPIAFAAVATNLINGHPEAIAVGNLGKAVQASCSWTPLYKPVVMGTAAYADGGIQANLPAAWARNSGAQVVIVIDVDEELRAVEPRTLRSLTGLASRISTLVVTTLDQYHTKANDIVIKPDVTGIPLLAKDTNSLTKAIAAGEKAAIEALPEIKKRLATIDTTTY